MVGTEGAPRPENRPATGDGLERNVLRCDPGSGFAGGRRTAVEDIKPLAATLIHREQAILSMIGYCALATPANSNTPDTSAKK